MKRTVLILLNILLLQVPGFSQKLSTGLKIPVKIINEIHSDENGTVSAIVATDIITDGITVIKSGTPVDVNITRKEAKWCGKGGVVILDFVETQTIDNRKVLLTGRSEYYGKNKRGLAYGLGLGLGIWCWPCLSCLMIQGKDVVIQSNTVFYDVFVAYDVQ